MNQTEAFSLVKYGSAEAAFKLGTVTLSPLGENQVLVETESFGLNYAEVMARRGLYAEAPPLPAVLGYEVVGKIVEVGEHVDQSLVGKRVLAFCRFGGYAKHVITESHAIAELGVYDSSKALALATQYVTAYYMVERVANIQKDEIVLVHAAAGGVGTALIQLCKLKGATVIAKVSSDSKIESVKAQGADFAVNYKSSDYEAAVSSILKEHRVDVSFNPVAGATVKKDLRLIGSGGRLVLFGASELGKAPYGIFSKLNFVRKIGFFTPIAFMMRSKSVCGVNMLKIADNKPLVLQACLNEVVAMAVAGTINPQVGKEYPASEMPRAHQDLEDGSTIGKLVINW
jgi:NADPH2:quinone reductase